jgi:hypothetical protein
MEYLHVTTAWRVEHMAAAERRLVDERAGMLAARAVGGLRRARLLIRPASRRWPARHLDRRPSAT